MRNFVQMEEKWGKFTTMFVINGCQAILQYNVHA